MNDPSSIKGYFSRSPFRSVSFDLLTLVLLIFVLWGVRAIDAMKSASLKASDAVFALVLLPIAIWIYSLLLHWEIRIYVERIGQLPAYSRLAQLHRGLIFSVTLFSYVIIEALIRTFG
ncbi:MAG: hypothetical protein WCD27_05030 [Candidatus Acidiferrales bacterium]